MPPGDWRPGATQLRAPPEQQHCCRLRAARFGGFLHGCGSVQLGNTLKSSVAKQTRN